MTSSPARWRAAIVTLLVGASLSGAVAAYSLYGYKWPSREVYYYVNPANGDVSPDLAEAAIRTGANAWSLQSNADITLVYAGRTGGTTVVNNGKNEVFFRPESNGGTIATTYYWWSGSTMVDADIKFWDAGFKFFTGTSGCSGGIYIEDVATHEFGHVLGIGHSSVSAATMSPTTSYCSQNWRSLDVDDMSGVEALYPPGTSVYPPSAPTSLTATASSSSSALANWRDTATNETQFLVERSTSGGTYLQVATLGANTTSYGDSGLTSGTTYTYRVRALNNDGYSAYSNLASVTPQGETTPTPTPTPAPSPAAPAAPTLLTPANGAVVSGKVVGLTWAAASGATSYDVYWGTASNPPLLKSNLTSLKLNVKPAKTTYYWRVVAKNASGATSSTTASFRVQ